MCLFLPLDQWTGPLGHGHKCLVAGYLLDDLEQIPRTLRLGGLFHLDQEQVMDHGAVGPQMAVDGEEVIDLHLLHCLHDCVGIIGACLLDRLQVIHGGGIDPCLVHGRHGSGLGKVALGPLARGLVAIPVEGGGEFHPLGDIESKALDIGQKDQHAGDGLPALNDAELSGLLNGVDKVTAGVGQTDNLGARGLGLEQVGGEVGGSQRVTDLSQNLAAVCLDEGGGVLFQGVAEGIIRCEEEPGLAAMLNNGAACHLGEGIGIVNVVNAVGAAVFVGRAVLPAPVEMVIIFFSVPIFCTARAQPELSSPTTIST